MVGPTLGTATAQAGVASEQDEIRGVDEADYLGSIVADDEAPSVGLD